MSGEAPDRCYGIITSSGSNNKQIMHGLTTDDTCILLAAARVHLKLHRKLFRDDKLSERVKKSRKKRDPAGD